jgi:hypothetical protein
MVETSRRGIEILRTLALAVRSEMDFDLIPEEDAVVGAIKEQDAEDTAAIQAKQQGGYAGLLAMEGYVPLNLRGALNKIAHADPKGTDYYVGPGDTAHDLLLYGRRGGRRWFAAVSLLRLVKVIRELPDATIRQD